MIEYLFQLSIFFEYDCIVALITIDCMGGCQNMSEQVVLNHNFQGIQVVIRSWKKTYANLYDYLASPDQIITQTLRIAPQTRLVKQSNKYQQLSLQQKQSTEQAQAVLDFTKQAEKKGGHLMVSSKNAKNKQQLWVVVKSLPSKRYMIKQGDLLRVGKQKLRVKQIVQRGEQQQQEQDQSCTAKGILYQNLTRQGKPVQLKPEQAQNYTCKFCLDPGEVGNPLLCPCSCSGSSRYIHLKCVQTWLTKTINPRNVGQAVAMNWKPLICQICKKTLPFKVYLDGRRYFTVNIPKPRKPYLVLNPLYRQKENGKGKIYFLISFAQKRQMVVGRKSDCDIIISDQSTVSRKHCNIVYEKDGVQNKGKFYIQDKDSKFGTLALLRKELVMSSVLNGVCLQLGGDLLELRQGGGLKKADLQGGREYQEMINREQSDGSSDHEQAGEDQNQPGNEQPTNARGYQSPTKAIRNDPQSKVVQPHSPSRAGVHLPPVKLAGRQSPTKAFGTEQINKGAQQTNRQ